MENWCYYCKSEGKDVVAKFTIDGHPACAVHYMAWRKEHPAESPKPLSFDVVVHSPSSEESPPMQTKPDYAAMQADRDAGMKPKDIAEKYKVSYQSVFNHTKTPKVPRPSPRLLTHRGVTTAPAKKTDEAFAKNSSIEELLAKLKARRAALDEAIEALEMAAKVLARSEELV